MDLDPMQTAYGQCLGCIKPDANYIRSAWADWRTHAHTKERLDIRRHDADVNFDQGHSTDELATSFRKPGAFVSSKKTL